MALVRSQPVPITDRNASLLEASHLRHQSRCSVPPTGNTACTPESLGNCQSSWPRPFVHVAAVCAASMTGISPQATLTPKQVPVRTTAAKDIQVRPNIPARILVWCSLGLIRGFRSFLKAGAVWCSTRVCMAACLVRRYFIAIHLLQVF